MKQQTRTKTVAAKSKDASQEQFSPERIAYNNNILYFCRILVGSAAGSAAGILQLTAIWGALFYFLTYGLLSLFIFVKLQFKTETYFISSNNIVYDGIFHGMLVQL